MNLKSGYELRVEIQSLKETIEELKVNIQSLSSVQLKERVQGGENSPDKSIIDKLSKLYELEEKLEKLVEFQIKIATEIEHLEDWKERVVLRYRYINNFTWEHISERTGYSKKQISRIHKRAIINFRKNFAKCP
jgi:DNA-directed RNA polymerase specialized sigma subunit